MKKIKMRDRFKFEVSEAKTLYLFDNEGQLIHEVPFPPPEENLDAAAEYLGMTPRALHAMLEYQAYLIERLEEDLRDIMEVVTDPIATKGA